MSTSNYGSSRARPCLPAQTGGGGGIQIQLLEVEKEAVTAQQRWWSAGAVRVVQGGGGVPPLTGRQFTVGGDD
jgi:hypothetical protein